MPRMKTIMISARLLTNRQSSRCDNRALSSSESPNTPRRDTISAQPQRCLVFLTELKEKRNRLETIETYQFRGGGTFSSSHFVRSERLPLVFATVILVSSLLTHVRSQPRAARHNVGDNVIIPRLPFQVSLLTRAVHRAPRQPRSQA